MLTNNLKAGMPIVFLIAVLYSLLWDICWMIQ